MMTYLLLIFYVGDAFLFFFGVLLERIVREIEQERVSLGMIRGLWR